MYQHHHQHQHPQPARADKQPLIPQRLGQHSTAGADETGQQHLRRGLQCKVGAFVFRAAHTHHRGEQGDGGHAVGHLLEQGHGIDQHGIGALPPQQGQRSDAERLQGAEQDQCPQHADAGVEQAAEQGATDAGQAVAHGTLQFIAVGTPPDEDGSADLKYVLKVAETIGQHMTDYRLVITKSTVPVGTSDKVRQALAGVLAERKDRWQALMQVVRESDVSLWRDLFVSTLRSIPAGGGAVPEV